MNIRRGFPDKVLLGNISYIAILQGFNVIAPLITYPYLVRVLGMELYGTFISAQILVSYFSIFIILGTDGVCAKHISINRNNPQKLSEIFSAVLFLRTAIWLVGLFVYLFVVFLISTYRSYFIIFLFTYGLTFHEVLFPQYLFQGLEKMKYTTIINISAKLLFILTVFFVVKNPDDVFLVPILYSIGFFMGGIGAVIIVIKYLELRIVWPNLSLLYSLIKECLPLFSSDLIMTIKDRFNILLMGNYIGMANVVVYDFAMKINLFLVKPSEILRIALFPRAAKEKSVKLAEQAMYIALSVTTGLVVILNIFLPSITEMFLGKGVDLLPIRLFTIAPILLSSSTIIASNVFVAFGFNKYILNSIIVTTICYILLLTICALTRNLYSIYSFVMISLASYMTELVYRLIKYQFIKNKYKQSNKVNLL